VLTSDFGLGIAIDIEGNCRLYDLVRLKKIARMSSSNQRGEDIKFGPVSSKWRLLPTPALDSANETFIAALQTFNLPEGLPEIESEEG